MIELKTYAGSNVTPQNDAIMNDTNTLNNGIYYGCNVTIKDATTLHINAGQGIVYGRLFEVLDSDIPVSLSPSGTLLGQLYVHIDLSNIAAPIQILVDTGETLANLEDDPQLNIDSGITDMQLATFTVSTVGMSDLVETFAEVEPIRAVLGDADISAIGDGSVKGAIRTINTHLSELTDSVSVPVTSVATWNDVLPALFLACDLTKVSGKSYIDSNGTYFHCVKKSATSAIFSNSIVRANATAYTVSAVMANGGQAYNILNESTGAITSGLTEGVGFNGKVVLHY
jgi:hypothetical protein